MSSYQGNIIIKNPAIPTGPVATGRAPGMWKLDEVAYWVKQGLWPNANIVADQYFPYVSLLLSTTSLGNANNNLFVDSSGAFNPISRSGNTTQGSVTPYSTNWSNYFDGSGDFLSVPDNAALDFETGNFTVEMWVYFSSTVSSNNALIAGWTTGEPVSGWVLAADGTNFYFVSAVSTVYATQAVNTAARTPGVWHHVAAVRSSGSVTVYVNGVGGTPVSNAQNITTAATGLNIGRSPYTANPSPFTGYISNLRMVKGTAVYTSNFTPPTAPLTAITNTSLLTCQSNRFRDASTNNFTITRNGDTRTTDFSPFAPASPGIVYNQSDITNWSGYFDGSGDYLSSSATTIANFGTGDFTVECWVYSLATGQLNILDFRGTGGTGSAFRLGQVAATGKFAAGWGSNDAVLSSTTNILLNQWVYIAVTRSGSTARMFINGVLEATATDSTSIPDSGMIVASYQGSAAFFNGSISNLRVVKGTAVYTGTFAPPTTNLTAISGTSLLTLQNAAFTDNSTNNFVITPFGNTTVTGNSPFNTVGYWSLYGPPTAGATVPQTTATDLGSGSFTVECWVNLQNYTTDGIVTKRRTDTALTGSWGLFVTTSGFIRFQGVGWATTYTATTNAIPLNTWTHVAVSRSGTNLSVYVNGARVINATDSYDYTCSTYMIIKLGGNSGGNYPSGGALNGGVTGSISNLRIVQGTAVYNPASTTVTVPTSPLTAISGTSFLTLQNGTMKDNSTNNNTSILLYNSAAAIQPFNPFYTATIASNGGSMYFDGTGDYLRSNIPSLNIRAPFTVEGWAYLSTVTNFVFFSASTTAGAAGQALYLNELSGTVYFGDGVTNNISFSNSLLPINSWAHIACTFDGTTYRVFINGTSAGSSTSLLSNYTLNSIDVGARLVSVTNYATGYISNFRITGGTALYTATFTPPTAPLTPSANTGLLVNGMNAGVYDATAINDMETVGNAQVSTAVSKFGGSSMAFDGAGDYVVIPSSNEIALGSGDFTIEFWVYLNSNSIVQLIYDQRSGQGAYPAIYMPNASIRYYVNSVDRIIGGNLNTATWYHIAICRSGTSTRMFIDGTQSGSTYTDTTNYLAAPLFVGADKGPSSFMNGYIDDLRITKGVARYTANFTPPTQAFPTY